MEPQKTALANTRLLKDDMPVHIFWPKSTQGKYLKNPWLTAEQFLKSCRSELFLFFFGIWEFWGVLSLFVTFGGFEKGLADRGVGARKSFPYHRFKLFFCPLLPMPLMSRKRNSGDIFCCILGAVGRPFRNPWHMDIWDAHQQFCHFTIPRAKRWPCLRSLKGNKNPRSDLVFFFVCLGVMVKGVILSRGLLINVY